MQLSACMTVLALLLVVSTAAGALGLSLRDAVHHLHHSTAGVEPNANAATSSSTGGPSAFEVHRLPGLQQGLPSKHYAGYVTVDDDTQRQLFYYLVTHEGPSEGVSAPRQDEDDTPLIVWLTGGPGCSSMDAFTYENGPFVFTAPAAEAAGQEPSLQDIQLHPNPYSWSKTAHVVYIDSPAGTGFSYTPGEAAYHTDDDKTIKDLEVFVEGFFQQHAWLRQQPLYVAGESYGGVYVPLLAHALLRHNQRLQQQQHASAAPSSTWVQGSAPPAAYNLVGYVVGNGVTDDVYDGSGQVEFAFGLGLIDPQTYKAVKHTCKANAWHVAPDSPCANALDTMESTMGPINPYNILGQCFHPPGTTDLHATTSGTTSTSGSSHPHSPAQAFRAGSSDPASAALPLLTASRKLQMQEQKQRLASQVDAGAQLASAVGAGRLRAAQRLQHAVSCADRRYASVYYNSPQVRRALHAAGTEESGRWEPCSDVLHYTHTVGSMIPVHRELLESGLRGLVLSGDHDYVVPYTGTRAWVYDLGLRQSRPWHSWSLQGTDQVSGYAVEFKAGLTFATVKGGGHMVPQTHPQAALSLLQQWLRQEL